MLYEILKCICEIGVVSGSVILFAEVLGTRHLGVWCVPKTLRPKKFEPYGVHYCTLDKL
jgi:hypothetical protein